MSSMLEQAIIDAKALKESAIKNAENMIIEKYSDQIKLAVNELLEQEEHVEQATEDLAITDIRTVEGRPVQLKDIQPHTVVTVNGISGQVDHLTEAGLLSKSIYAGNYDDYLDDAEDFFEVSEESEDTQ